MLAPPPLRNAIALLASLAALACTAAPKPAASDKASGSGPEDSASPAGSPDCSGGSPSMELGTGEASFEVVADGDEIPIINGPQGGQHILGSLRTHDMSGVATIRFTIQRAVDLSYVSDQTYRLQLFQEGDCAWSYFGLYGYLGFVAVPEDDAHFLYEDALMAMEITDDGGRSTSAQLQFIPVLGPSDMPGGDPGGGAGGDPGGAAGGGADGGGTGP